MQWHDVFQAGPGVPHVLSRRWLSVTLCWTLHQVVGYKGDRNLDFPLPETLSLQWGAERDF
jgi:hypothetical protein